MHTSWRAALLITSRLEPDAAARAYRAGAWLLTKPFDPADIIEFARTRAARGRLQLRRLLVEWTRRNRLTNTEAEILEAAIEGDEQADIALRRRVSRETIRKQASAIVQKTGDATLKDAAIRALREVVTGRTQPPRAR